MFAMASTFAILLLMSSGLFKTTTGDYCYSYLTKDNKLKDTINCLGLYCCGSCEFRYCCPLPSLQFTESEQFFCNFNSDIVIALIVGVVITIIGIIVCCFVCRMCRRTRPVAGAHVTTVMNTTQLVQQQPAIQNPAYQPVPTQPGYSVQPAQLGPYPPQLSAPVPYNTAMSPEYPTVQAYNPAYTQPAKTGF
ncbi:protein shisa-4 [Danio aesculapii]|uniref:protein shisa-4 n=1 Tax=Danio aesculapii TaxID=1142201 RepID=UPI0024BF2745|nr:protein shisa-4 [Danio aesculapii]